MLCWIYITELYTSLFSHTDMSILFKYFFPSGADFLRNVVGKKYERDLRSEAWSTNSNNLHIKILGSMEQFSIFENGLVHFLERSKSKKKNTSEFSQCLIFYDQVWNMLIEFWNWTRKTLFAISFLTEDCTIKPIQLPVWCRLSVWVDAEVWRL